MPNFARTLSVQFATAAHARGGRAFIVGGAVRDELLGREPKDIDLEVFGVPEADLEPLLRTVFQHVKNVGRSFPVWKAWTDEMGEGEAVDVALPRRERKTGPRHTDFSSVADPAMSVADAAARRDFTINAILLDPLTGAYVDPHAGIDDLRNRRLRHVSARFSEDALRVLRGAKCMAQFGLTAAPETIALCQQLTPAHLPPDRVFGELSKLLLKGERPSVGLEFLRACNWVQYFPELAAVIGVQQNPVHHPEGDVWQHTLHCVDAFAATRTGVAEEDLIVGLAVLCHDFGKATHTQLKDGKWISHGHEAAGELPTRSFLGRMTADARLTDAVVGLVVRHMVPKSILALTNRGQNMDRQVRRLSAAVRLDRLARVTFCDDAGRPPKPRVSPAAVLLTAAAERLKVASSRPTPLLSGRHLIAVGESPRPEWGPVLANVYSMQLDGTLTSVEDALEVARAQLCSPEYAPKTSSTQRLRPTIAAGTIEGLAATLEARKPRTSRTIDVD